MFKQHVHHRQGLGAGDLVIDVFAFAAGVDEALLAQYAQLLRQGGLGDAHQFLQFAHTLFALRHHLGFLFEAADDSVNGIEEILLAHGLTVATGSNQSGFITYVGDVGARESRCLTRQKVHIEVVCKFERTQVDIEDGDALRQFGKVNMDLTIETSGTQEGRVEDFNAVLFDIEHFPNSDIEFWRLDQHSGCLVIDSAAMLGAEKSAKWDRIKAERDHRTENGGYKAGTKWFHSDQKSRSQQLGLVLPKNTARAVYEYFHREEEKEE